MSRRRAFRNLRLLAQIRMLWRRVARGLADMLPKGLYKRSLLIVIVPMVLLQSAVTLAFMQHHWDLVTRRLSEAVARDVGALTDLYKRLPPGQDDTSLASLASERFRMDASLLPAGPLPPVMPRSFYSALDPLTRTLPNEIKKQNSPTLLDRHHWPIGAHGNPCRPWEPSAAPGDAPRARLRGERPYFRALDAGSDDPPPNARHYFPPESESDRLCDWRRRRRISARAETQTLIRMAPVRSGKPATLSLR